MSALGTARSRGFSMVELLCSVALSLVLLAGVVATLSSSYTSYQSSDRVSQMEERGWHALDLLSRDIRGAGFRGCTREPSYQGTTLKNTDEVPWDFLGSAVRGYQAMTLEWSMRIEDMRLESAAQDSDVLVLRIPKRGVEPLRLRADMAEPEDHLSVNGPASSLRANDIALIYDCDARVYFQATSVSDDTIQHGEDSAALPGNATPSLGRAFRKGAEIIPVQTVAYYIRADSPERLEEKSLWRRVGSNAPERLVQHVEQMQLLFGLDVSGDARIDRYVTADEVPDWARVYSVSVALLVASDDEAPSSPRSFSLLDTTVRTNGDRLRQVFSTTASLRNPPG